VGRIDVTGRRGRRCKELLDDLEKNRGFDKLKTKTVQRTLWRTQLGSGYGHVVGQTTWWRRREW